MLNNMGADYRLEFTFSEREVFDLTVDTLYRSFRVIRDDEISADNAAKAARELFDHRGKQIA
jgi:hypothetical protein